MTPLPSPTTPRSPRTPTTSHPLESNTGAERPTPRLQVVTNFPIHSILRQPSVSQMSTPSRNRAQHRRISSSMSSITFSPTTEAMLNLPLTSLPTPMSPWGSLYPMPVVGPSARADDGRQSRMDIRSPLPQGMYSPILERIISLPLRVSPNPTPPAHVSSHPEPPQQSPNANATQKDSDDEYVRWRPWTPVHARAAAISLPPSRASSRNPSPSNSQSRSPIRRTSKTRRADSLKKRGRSPPPRYHVTVVSSLASTLASTFEQRQQHSQFSAYRNAVSHLHTPLVPLISVTTGLSHPRFPRSLLQYHLLTHEQLDSLARWYHQTDPATEESWMYPAWIPPYTSRASSTATNTRPSSDVTLTTKRRRWGRFIGLRGCDSPEGLDTDEQESLVERMEREWRRALERAREEEIMREKSWRGRW